MSSIIKGGTITEITVSVSRKVSRNYQSAECSCSLTATIDTLGAVDSVREQLFEKCNNAAYRGAVEALKERGE